MKLKWKREDTNYYTLDSKKFSGQVYLAHSDDNEWQWNIGNEKQGKSGTGKTRADCYRQVKEFAQTMGMGKT